MPLKVTVGILTFHRPEHIYETVRQVHEQVAALRPLILGQILVVDNDPDGSGRAAVDATIADHELSGVRYVIEPTPGIAAGRNRVLDESADRDLVLFLDDDGRPGDRWLERMVACWQATRPAAVAGWVDTR